MTEIRAQIDNETLRIRCEALMEELQAAYAFGNKLLQENAALRAELNRPSRTVLAPPDGVCVTSS